jgi:hypothetical protein
MIERDIKKNTDSGAKMAKEIKVISAWQVRHQRKDDANNEVVMAHLAALPTEQSITDTIRQTVATSIQANVNGKIDKLTTSVTEVKEHLSTQDENLAALSVKVLPFDTAKTWIYDAFKVVVGVGTFCGAAYAVISLLQLLNWVH